MGKPQRTPAAKFDDIPGELPHGTIPDGTDLSRVAQEVVDKLNDLQPNDLTDHPIWRDLLSFTGTYRTFHSKDTVFDTLQKLSRDRNRTRVRLCASEPRQATSLDDIAWVDVDITFQVEQSGLLAQCKGTASITRCMDGQWRIWMLRTWLESFNGYGHPDIIEQKPADAVATTDQATNGHVIDNVNGQTNGIGSSGVDYDAIVVGGGQAGLSTAGRLKALGVRYVLLERRPEIGHVWATRYESLRWHTSKHYGSLPFGHTYPEEDDYMLPAKRIGAGHKAWAEKHGINVRTNTSVDWANWDDSSSTWTVSTSSPDGEHTMTARNLVLAIGPGHLTPIRPAWAVPEKIAASGFGGTVLHGSEYKSSLTWSGREGVVVGTANTGHDVAEDMANAGMTTTMVQRGATFIFPVEWLHSAEDIHYNPNIDPALADRESFTYPNKIMRQIINRAVWKGIEGSPERFDALEKSGFKVERYGDIYNNLYVRFGGHYVDIGASARIARGEIKVKTESVTALTKDGLLFDDGSEVKADLIVLATGFDHDFRNDAARLVGRDVANQMDDFWGVDREGEIIGHAKLAGHPHLYYHGGDIRMARFFSRFIALQIQADALGQPLQRYLDEA